MLQNSQKIAQNNREIIFHQRKKILQIEGNNALLLPQRLKSTFYDFFDSGSKAHVECRLVRISNNVEFGF